MGEGRTIAGIGEQGILEIINSIVPTATTAGLGIGDDTAIISHPSSFLISTDSMVENVHFSLQWAPFKAIGFKSVVTNVSDIAAMGGEPRYFLLSLGLPQTLTLQQLEELSKGIAEAAAIYNIELVGGNLSQSASLFITITITGDCPKTGAIRRNGASIGDLVCVTGTVGDAAAGLLALQKGMLGRPSAGLNNSAIDHLARRHLFPTARVAEGRRIALAASSMIDVSDGLSSDAGRLSINGRLSCNIDTHLLPLSAALKEVSADWSTDPVGFAMYGGEDYELLFTIAPTDKNRLENVEFTVIGAVDSWSDSTGEGFNHFCSAT